MSNLTKRSVSYYMIDQDPEDDNPILRIDSSNPVIPEDDDDLEIDGVYYQVVYKEFSYLSNNITNEVEEEVRVHLEEVPEFTGESDGEEYVIYYQYYNPTKRMKVTDPAVVIKIKEILDKEDED